MYKYLTDGGIPSMGVFVLPAGVLRTRVEREDFDAKTIQTGAKRMPKGRNDIQKESQRSKRAPTWAKGISNLFPTRPIPLMVLDNLRFRVCLRICESISTLFSRAEWLDVSRYNSVFSREKH
jgi:hypothetical protein